LDEIDVVIPVYNGEPYINEAIDSVLQQTFKPRRIIVVDDGSTDGTPKLLESYQTLYPTVKYVRKSNAGLSSARNVGILSSDSRYVAFLDADDVWHPTKLEKQLHVFRNKSFGNLGFIYCDYSNIDSLGAPLVNFPCFEMDFSVKGNVFQKLLRIPAYPDGESGNIRTAFRQHPDTCRAVSF